MGCEAAPEGGPAARIAASYLGSGYTRLMFFSSSNNPNNVCNFSSPN